jgi:hypothetical protein
MEGLGMEKSRIFYGYLVQFGIFCRPLAYFVAIWHILWPFGIFFGHLAYFVAIWYIFSHFGMLFQEKSGNHLD